MDSNFAILSSELETAEARRAFARRLAEFASTAFSTNAVVDDIQRSADHAKLEVDAAKLREAMEESTRVFEAISAQATSLAGVIDAGSSFGNIHHYYVPSAYAGVGGFPGAQWPVTLFGTPTFGVPTLPANISSGLISAKKKQRSE